jgi:outer membrane protein TolC
MNRTNSLLLTLLIAPAGCAMLDPEPTGAEIQAVWKRIGTRTVPRMAAPERPPSSPGRDQAPKPSGADSHVKPDALPIDLATALQLAGENNLTIRAAEAAVEEARGLETAAGARFLPTVAPGYAYYNKAGRTQNQRGDTFDANRDNHRALNRTILSVNPARAWLETLQARRVRRAGEFAEQAARNDVGLLTAVQFFDFARAARQIEVAEELVRQTEELVRINRERVDRGVGLRVDLTRAEARAAEADQFLAEAQAAYRIAGIRLSDTLQLPAGTSLYPADPPAGPVVFVAADAPLGELQEQALASNPVLKQQAMLVSAAERAAEGAALEPLLPRLNLEAGHGGFGRVPGTMGWVEEYNVGFAWELDGLGVGNAGRTRAARARLAGAELRAEEARRRLLALVAESYEEVRLQSSLLEVAARQVAAAEESYRLASNRLRDGTGLLRDVLDAQNQLVRARVNRLNAVAEFNKAQYRLFNRLGNPAAPPSEAAAAK